MGELGVTGSGVGPAGGASPAPASVDDRARGLIADTTRTLGTASYVDTKDLAAAARATGPSELNGAIEAQLSPVQRGEFTRELDRLTSGQQWGMNQILGANDDFVQNYNDMRAANTINADG